MGKFTERNGVNILWNIQTDIRVINEIKLRYKEGNQSIQISFSIINFTNLLNKNWGKSYFLPNTFNSEESVRSTKTTYL